MMLLMVRIEVALNQLECVQTAESLLWEGECSVPIVVKL